MDRSSPRWGICALCAYWLPAPGSVNRDGWTMEYAATAWDSLNVYNIAYNGVTVATGIKLVEWHADYGSSGYRDSTGCSSGGGVLPFTLMAILRY
ncbi:MAG: hypothetical protein HC804_03060 [Anaerolineae bacterium]|nr:hypothetical protein [Anaerolineae bacterium]